MNNRSQQKANRLTIDLRKTQKNLPQRGGKKTTCNKKFPKILSFLGGVQEV